MITEDYVSFETAKLLKEKGFDESVGFVYSENGELLKLSAFGVRYLLNSECDDYSHWQFPIEDVVSIVSAPTIQMAMKWLRKNYGIFCTLRQYVKKDTEEISYNWNVEGKLGISVGNDGGFKTYEEACEAGIKYCLENLI